MFPLSPKIGEMVRIPQNALLVSEKKKKWLKLPEPQYGVIVEIKAELFPVVYKVFISGNIWEAAEKDIQQVEDYNG